MSKRRIPKSEAKGIANERIEILFDLSDKEMKKGRPERAKRYLDLALRIGMRYKISVSRYKMRYCPDCRNLYRFPETASIRLKRGRIIVKCNACGCISRYPYKR